MCAYTCVFKRELKAMTMPVLLSMLTFYKFSVKNYA